eukprot:CAMPEP_0115001968 /NCGR_PEP_ID=MMETSP0216-20121206/17721_1 /TAXON_ID=223996 /ORGANISM="Protocruzia adherens, Strain Boccale" /LENGTH=129 /DNA_ID=CAMNT_0002367463 /DNA_START=696 /DNA_END=1085 /DNA_ORIENTATION=+
MEWKDVESSNAIYVDLPSESEWSKYLGTSLLRLKGFEVLFQAIFDMNRKLLQFYVTNLSSTPFPLKMSLKNADKLKIAVQSKLRGLNRAHNMTSDSSFFMGVTTDNLKFYLQTSPAGNPRLLVNLQCKA